MQCYRSPRLSDTVVGLGALRHSLLSVFFFHGSGPHRHLHSFPTRRSSDLAEARVDAGDRVWAALGFVALEQRRAGPTIEDPRQLPRQVVGVGDAAVHAESAQRCGDMRRVAGEKDATDLVAVRDERGVLPNPVAEVLQLDTVVAEAAPDELDATLLGERSDGFRVRIEGDYAEP